MAELVILGTAASVPNADHDTVSMLLRGEGWAILIDCGGSPLHKLARQGIALDEIRGVILTHHHADHIYGLPMLIQGLWLSGRQEDLPIYAPAQTIARALPLLELFELAERDGMFRIRWHTITLREARPVLALDHVRITATPVDHGSNDAVALRFDNATDGHSIVYSADTRPSQALVRLAAGAGLLIHEATGVAEVHSSPAEAAEVARQAGVERLALIHYPVIGVDLESWRAQAAGFPGEVRLARDGDVYPL